MSCAAYFGPLGGNPTELGINSVVNRGYVLLSLQHTF